MKVSRVKYKTYAGPRIRGEYEFLIDDETDHWEKVLWLTSKVESGGKFGAITMYDGTACTAGLHQAIAVYPRELLHEDFAAKDDQGSLWKLLRMMEMIPNFPELEALWEAFKTVNWYVSSDGHVRYLVDSTVKVKARNRKVKAGDLVYGYEIRNILTPVEGTTPARGTNWEKSKAWAILFGAVFSSPKGFKAQVKFGQEHFNSYCRNKKLKVGGETKTVGDWVYHGRSDSPDVSSQELDLALAVLWSHSVNAPSRAWAILRKALTRHDVDSPAFPGVLLTLLGKSTHGRWNHTEKSGRWARTRSSAMKSGYWPASLFKSGGIMPKNL